jgi:hypothetical protein
MQPPSVGMAEAMASQRTQMRPRDRLLVVLGVCLPVPVFAATGLSLPLPATVERMATELVPFAQPVTGAEGGVASGSIVLTEAEQARARLVVAQTRVAAEPAPQREVARGRGEKPAGKPAGPSRSDDTESVAVEHPVTADPAPVALPPLTPPAEDRKTGDTHEPKTEHQPKHESKPKPERKPKPKQERESKPKPPDEPKPEEKPKPPKPKPDPEDEPPARSGGERVEKDNGPDPGKPSESERRQSP